MMQHRLWTMVSVLLALMTAVPALALPKRNLTLAELVSRSVAVAVVQIEQSAGEWQEGRILTRHEARVESVWVGRAPERIEITTLGGFVGDIGQRVSGQVNLRAGERLTVFLVWDEGSDSYRLRGGTNGVFRVVTVAGQARVRGDLTPSPLADSALPALAELEAQVREVARAN